MLPPTTHPERLRQIIDANHRSKPPRREPGLGFKTTTVWSKKPTCRCSLAFRLHVPVSDSSYVYPNNAWRKPKAYLTP